MLVVLKILQQYQLYPDATKENEDNIEQSLIEAKKNLSLLLIRTQRKTYIEKIKEEAHLFAIGDYKKLLEVAEENGLKCSKYDYISKNEPLKQVLSAADIMLQIIIKNAHTDKRLLL